MRQEACQEAVAFFYGLGILMMQPCLSCKQHKIKEENMMSNVIHAKEAEFNELIQKVGTGTGGLLRYLVRAM